jgi:hypothetical protein
MRFSYLAVIAIFISSCVSVPTPATTPTSEPPYRITPDENPFIPKLEDVSRQIATVNITNVVFSEQYEYSPPRAAIRFIGYMPSVCNELRIDISEPDEEFNVFIEVYSLINPDIQCDNVFQQFEASVLMGTYSPGRYYVWINGALAGDFVSY